MKIVTTPMCEDIVIYAGIEDYVINKFPKKGDGDLAVLLSESETELNSVKIKLNTFKQIKQSIEKISKYGKEPDMDTIFDDYPLAIKYLGDIPENSTKLKVYSNFLTDIAIDMGFKIVDNNPDFIIAPDYLANKIDGDIISIPSHGNVPLNPLEKASIRYEILEDYINNK